MDTYNKTTSQDFSILRAYFQEYYNELKEIAHHKLYKERSHQTFDTSALVHEAYHNLANQNFRSFNNSPHFLAIASIVMRRVLIDYARHQKRQKRGGDLIKMSYGAISNAVDTTPEDILALNDALTQLRKLNRRQSKVVEYCFFGGFKHHEIATILNVSVDTVRRDWRLAKAWLSCEMKKLFQ